MSSTSITALPHSFLRQGEWIARTHDYGRGTKPVCQFFRVAAFVPGEARLLVWKDANGCEQNLWLYESAFRHESAVVARALRRAGLGVVDSEHAERSLLAMLQYGTKLLGPVLVSRSEAERRYGLPSSDREAA